MNNEKLAKYLSVSLWGISEDRIKQLLDDFKGDENKETPPVKHPIELVNEKYPNGWYCEVFEEVKEDISTARPELDWCRHEVEDFLGWNFIQEKWNRGYNGCSKIYKTLDANATKITKSEYLSITRPQLQQRDYTGVIFRHKDGLSFGKITSKDTFCYYADFIGKDADNRGNWIIKDVEKWFKDGTWIEVKEETSSIHVEKPNTLEDRVKALEDRIERLEQDYETPTLKRNLPIDDDWNKVECLSWDNIKGYIKTDCFCDVHELITNKLIKK